MFAIKNLLTEIGFARVKTVTPLDMSHFSVNEDKFEIAFNVVIFFISAIYIL